MKQNKTKYYIGLEKPELARKQLLECARGSVDVLKSQFRLLEIRQERKKLLGELYDTLSDIRTYLAKLEDLLPDHSQKTLPSSLKKIHSPKKKNDSKSKKNKKVRFKRQSLPDKELKVNPEVKVVKKPKKELPKVKTSFNVDDELNQLEGKLASIENKLNKL